MINTQEHTQKKPVIAFKACTGKCYQQFGICVTCCILTACIIAHDTQYCFVATVLLELYLMVSIMFMFMQGKC